MQGKGDEERRMRPKTRCEMSPDNLSNEIDIHGYLPQISSENSELGYTLGSWRELLKIFKLGPEHGSFHTRRIANRV